jgi:hypothetical protein
MRAKIKLALIGIALAALLVGSRAALEHVRDQGRAEVQSVWDADKLIRAQALQKMTVQFRQAEQGFAVQLSKAQNEFTQNTLQLTADANRARATANSLRSDLNVARARLSAATGNTCAAITEYAHTITDVFEQCTTEYRRVAEDADKHAADAELMRVAWPRVLTSAIEKIKV